MGRETELLQLQTYLDKALNGQPQLIFVIGEPGIGKTTLVDRFREQLRASGNLTIGRGQCVEQYGGGEAYLPILEALSRLCREGGEQEVVALLRQYAPTWLVQLPGAITVEERQALQLQVQGATQQRMLRELAEVIAAGTVRRPLVLLLEDLHWSDQATVELLSYLAQRRESGRFLVIGTYRPADLVTRNHPLKAIKQELHAKGQCEELRVELLSKQEVNDYLTQRFPQHQFPAELAEELHRRTEGNALFLVNVVEELLQEGHIVEEEERWLFKGSLTEVSVPDTLRQLIEKQVQQRSEVEQRLLEVASVVGTEFAVASVAAALKQDMDEIEEACENLSWQGHFLEERGIAEWPDRTVSGRYGFRHALYQNVLYERIAGARKIRLHRSIGERLEVAYGERAREIAVELALHFELGREPKQAVRYCQFAGENAVAKNAFPEAVTHLTKGLVLLKILPDTLESQQQECFLLATLGPSLTATKGLAAEEAAQAYRRAEELCQLLGDTPQLFPMLWGLGTFYMARGEMRASVALSQRLLKLAESTQETALLLQAHLANGLFFFHVGELVQAREHLERAIALYDRQQHSSLALHFGYDLGVASLAYLAQLLCYLGYPTLALQKNEQARQLARDVSHAHSTAYALTAAIWVHIGRRDPQAAQVQAEESITLCTEQDFPYWLTQGNILWGWAAARRGQEEGLLRMQQNLAQWRVMATETVKHAFLGLMADVYWQRRQGEEGVVLVDEALKATEKTGECFYEPELHRLKGELTLQKQSKGERGKGKVKNQKGTRDWRLETSSSSSQAPSRKPLVSSEAEAEACFLKAIDVAQRQ